MFASSYVVAVFFRLLNFAVSIGLIGYIFKRYVRSPLEAKMTAQEALLHGLAEKRTMLEGRCGELDEKIAAQQTWCIQLQEKVRWWHEAVMHAQQLVQAQHEKYQKIYEQMMKQRAEYSITSKTQCMILERALQQAQQELRKIYEDQEHGKQFINDIIKRIR